MIHQKECKQVIKDSWLLTLLSRHMEARRKNEDQSENNYKK